MSKPSPEDAGVSPLLTVKETGDGWGDGNQARFRDLAGCDDPPGGLPAYDDSGKAVGWCAVGPRSRYTRPCAHH